MEPDDAMDVDKLLTKAVQELKLDEKDNRERIFTPFHFDRLRYWKKTMQTDLAMLSAEQQDVLLQDLATLICIWETTWSSVERQNMLATSFVFLKLCQRRQWPEAVAFLVNKQCKSRSVWHQLNEIWHERVESHLPVIPGGVGINHSVGEPQ